jgi:hypothetical protein
MKRVFGRVVSSLLLCSMSCLALTQPAKADPVDSVNLISPAKGSILNPLLPFTITLDLLGGAATQANTCTDGKLADFQFAVELIDVHNFGAALGVSSGSNLDGWNQKIIQGGIECSFQVNPNGQADWNENISELDSSWFGVTKSDWSPNQTSSYGPAKNLVIAWKLNGNIVQNSFGLTSKGSPKIALVGLTRGQVVDYSTHFQVQATLDSSIKVDHLWASLDLTPNWRDPYSLNCSNDTDPLKSVQGDLTTYTSNCTLELRYFDSYPASLIVTPFLSLNSLIKVPDGASVTVNVGKIGYPEFEISPNPIEENSSSSQNYGDKAGESLISQTPKKPWMAPATFNLNGRACVVKQKGQLCDFPFQSQPISGADVKICVNGSCQSVQTQADGTFNLTKLVQVTSVKWSASVTYSGSPLPNWDDQQNPDGTSSQEFSVSDTVSLPPQPAPPLTKAQVKAAQQAMFNLGVSVMKSLTSNQLIQFGFLKFFLPGHRTITNSYAQDFCRQLPKVLPNLMQRVGFDNNADFNYVAGCASIATTIKLK